jgi:hypothetical protein
VANHCFVLCRATDQHLSAKNRFFVTWFVPSTKSTNEGHQQARQSTKSQFNSDHTFSRWMLIINRHLSPTETVGSFIFVSIHIVTGPQKPEPSLTGGIQIRGLFRLSFVSRIPTTHKGTGILEGGEKRTQTPCHSLDRPVPWQRQWEYTGCCCCCGIEDADDKEDDP